MLFRLTAFGKRFLCVACVVSSMLSVSGCAVVPGDSGRDIRDQSFFKIPTRIESSERSEVVPANIDVQKITAELIIETYKDAEKFLPVEPLSSLNFSAAAGASSKPLVEYKVGAGDILSIIVWDHPELTTPAGQFRSADQAGTVVSGDGTIFYPYVGVVSVAGRTTRQVRDLLISKLSHYIEKVQLDVQVAAYRSKRVYVVGEVGKPGLQEITDVPMTVLEAVNRAGGFTNEADHSQVLLTRKSVTYLVDIQSMYERGKIEQNVLLQDGDILNIPDKAQNKIFVLGEVAKPGSLVMNKRRSTLAEALSDAGYINQDRANPRWIYVMRGDDDKPKLFHLDGRSPDAMLLADKFPLKPRDIVYVDVADVVRWNKVVSNILPTAQTLYQLGNAKYPLFGGRN